MHYQDNYSSQKSAVAQRRGMIQGTRVLTIIDCLAVTGLALQRCVADAASTANGLDGEGNVPSVLVAVNNRCSAEQQQWFAATSADFEVETGTTITPIAYSTEAFVETGHKVRIMTVCMSVRREIPPAIGGQTPAWPGGQNPARPGGPRPRSGRGTSRRFVSRRSSSRADIDR